MSVQTESKNRLPKAVAYTPEEIEFKIWELEQLLNRSKTMSREDKAAQLERYRAQLTPHQQSEAAD